MADIALTGLTLAENQTSKLLELEPRAASTTIRRKMSILGNSLLSSVFIKSMDVGATLQVNYFDTTSGTELDSERFDLVGHEPINGVVTPTTFRITVPRIHNKPQVEAIVTGGSVEFGIYITVVSTFVSDIDQALIVDGETFDAVDTKGLPFACLDEAAGVMRFVRCGENGLLVETAEQGDPFHTGNTVTSSPGNEVSVFSFTVPTGTTRNLKILNVISSSPGCFSLEAGGSEIAAGILHETAKNVEFKFDPSRPIAAGTVVELKFTADSDPTVACPVTGFVSASDFS